MLNIQRLKYELYRNNLKQRDLADKIGISEVSMSRYVSGQRTPKGPLLVKMAKALGVTPEYLSGAEDWVNPDIAYGRARIIIREYGETWESEKIKTLISDMVDLLAERRKLDWLKTNV